MGALIRLKAFSLIKGYWSLWEVYLLQLQRAQSA